jgi:hypothetical protein
MKKLAQLIFGLQWGPTFYEKNEFMHQVGSFPEFVLLHEIGQLQYFANSLRFW